MFNILTHNYLTRGFWGDEAWTIGISRLPFKEIITVTSQDFHPPFYYFLVHILGNISGFTEIPIRLLSTFFFLLIPLTVYFLTQMLWKNKKNSYKLSSLITSLLVLSSPILFAYAFEARSYGLLAFESIVSALIFWRAKDELKGQYLWRILYFVVGGIMVYTHYYAWFILAGHAFYLLIFERKRILPMFTSAIGILIVQLPWLPTLIGQSGSVKNSYWIAPINIHTHWEFFYRIVGGDLATIMQRPLAYIIGGILVLDLIYRIVKRDFPKHYAFLVTWLLIPTLIPTLLSLVVVPIFYYRYLIFSAIPILILTIQACYRLPKQALLTFFAVTFAAELFVDYNIFAKYPYTMREEVNKLYETKRPGDGPVYTILPSFAEVVYYIGNKDEVKVLPEGIVQFSGKSLLDAYVRLGKTEIIQPDPPYWLLEPGPKSSYVK